MSLTMSDASIRRMRYPARSSAASRRASAGAFVVVRAIELDHQALRGSVEIRDEASQQRNLAAHYNAKPKPADAIPDQRLGGGQ